MITCRNTITFGPQNSIYKPKQDYITIAYGDRCYYVITIQDGYNYLSKNEIRNYIDEFTEQVKAHPEIEYRINIYELYSVCFTDTEILEMFSGLENVRLSSARERQAENYYHQFLDEHRRDFLMSHIKNKSFRHQQYDIFPILANSTFCFRTIIEAREYLSHPELGSFLRECVETLLCEYDNAEEIGKYIDIVRLYKSVTLFDAICPNEIFRQALDKYFNGRPEAATLKLLNGETLSTGIIGAIIGDIVGSRFEKRYNKSIPMDFELFTPQNKFTDDTVMTIAITQWLKGRDIVKSMHYWGQKYPNRGYGGRFRHWIVSSDTKPYNSYGNGSAMRVSPVGFYARLLEEALDLAKQSAEITHNHPEGIKGAQAIASAIFLARSGKSKEDIRDYVEQTFGYNLHRTCDEIRPTYRFDITCQGSCPEAIIAFLDSTDYESAIRLAVSLGGDTDTIACMTGGIAAAYYGVPDKLVKRASDYLPSDMQIVISLFERDIVDYVYPIKPIDNPLINILKSQKL